MVEIRFKHDQMKVSPDGVANNRGDPPRLFGARGDPSSGGKRAPTMVSNALPKDHPLLPIKNRDRLSALADGSKEVVQWHEMKYSNSERESVRLDDSPDVSLADFRCEGISRDREGFHRAPRAGKRMMNDEWRMINGECVRVDCFVLLRRPRNDDQNSSVIATLRHERGSNLLAIWEPIIR